MGQEMLKQGANNSFPVPGMALQVRAANAEAIQKRDVVQKSQVQRDSILQQY